MQGNEQELREELVLDDNGGEFGTGKAETIVTESESDVFADHNTALANVSAPVRTTAKPHGNKKTRAARKLKNKTARKQRRSNRK